MGYTVGMTGALLSPRTLRVRKGCRRPWGVASGKVSVLRLPLPRPIPPRSAGSAPRWGRGLRSITVPSSAKCGARVGRARGAEGDPSGSDPARASPIEPERPRGRARRDAGCTLAPALWKMPG